MSGFRSRTLALVLLSCAVPAHGDDLHFKKTISVGGNPVTSSEIWVKGARERSVTSSPAGSEHTNRGQRLVSHGAEAKCVVRSGGGGCEREGLCDGRV